MRKIKYLVILLVLFFICIPASKAKLTCKYGQNKDIIIEYNNNKISSVDGIKVEDSFNRAKNAEGDFSKTEVWTTVKPFLSLEEVKKASKSFDVDQSLFKHNKCPSQIYYCHNYLYMATIPSVGSLAELLSGGLLDAGVDSMITYKNNVFIYADEIEYKKAETYISGLNLTDEADVSDNESIWDWLVDIASNTGNAVKNIAWDGIGIYYYDTNCDLYKSDYKYTYMSSCKNYEEYYAKLINKLKKYKKCNSQQCKSDVGSEINKIESQLKQSCKSILSNYSYGVSGQKGCLDACFNLNEDIYNKHIKYGVIGKDSYNKCTNLSDKVMYFVHNILKWMKYIAPVLVIILGILDFIKALASSDDDAMKKAQKRFIIRLVAAALLFLLPLIIDYILRIFNLVDSSCDITNIF